LKAVHIDGGKEIKVDIEIGADGGKNCHVTITGQQSENFSKPAPILFFKDLSGSPERLRLDGLQFAIQEKSGFNLWWIMPEEKGIPAYKLIMPIESRGGFDFEKIKPVSSPRGALGLALTSFKVTEKFMSYLIMLDLTKQ
jgi:hypothetical protein